MKHTGDENWWMSIFDDVYLQTDARYIGLQDVGFYEVRFKTDFMCRDKLGDYGCMTNRMVALAKKPTGSQL
jgi:hypothetical protein